MTLFAALEKNQFRSFLLLHYKFVFLKKYNYIYLFFQISGCSESVVHARLERHLRSRHLQTKGIGMGDPIARAFFLVLLLSLAANWALFWFYM